MKKIVVVLLFFTLTNIIAQTQLNFRLYSEKTDKGYQILADNNEYCPVSVKVEFELKNLNSSNGNNKVFVIPAKSKGFKITDLYIVKRGRYGFSYRNQYNRGDYNITRADESYEYNLPFEKDKRYRVSQGYNGRTSHRGISALDFNMKIGTPIHAARGGIVVNVINHNTKNCKSKDCAEYNNKILIYHEDGTFGVYAHLKQNGALVEVGDKVTQGQLIGKSGNTGWTTGPHLHFEVYLPFEGGRNILPTLFKINDGETVEYLKEKRSYIRKYD